MEWLVKNWSLVVAGVCVLVGIVATWRRYYGLPRQEQIDSIKEWLLYAVIEAEKDLGSGTGKLKLRQVYDMFVERFPWAAKSVPFSLFAIWVDSALVDMRKILQANNSISTYVNPDNAWEER